jgi:hypothetical protein
VTAICGINGIHGVDLMTEQRSYNADYFPSNIMEPLLSAIFPGIRKPNSRWPSGHLNNYRGRRSKATENSFAKNDIVRGFDPASRPDVAHRTSGFSAT